MLFACAVDGMVACFDTTVELEDDAAEWTHIVGHPAQTLKLHGNYSAISTADHLLIALNEEILHKKI